MSTNKTLSREPNEAKPTNHTHLHIMENNPLFLSNVKCSILIGPTKTIVMNYFQSSMSQIRTRSVNYIINFAARKLKTFGIVESCFVVETRFNFR